MRRGLLIAACLTLTSFVFAPSANAQWGYPGGYGGYGWGGFGATTAGGDQARGMGVFAAGAGQYNLDTAQAASINANTVMRFNEYIYQSQQVRNQQYYQQLANRRERTQESAATVQKRLRENPESADIYRGDALNVILDDITAPGVYAQSVSSAGAPIPSPTVKSVPFQYAPQAITISLGQLTRREPPELVKDPRLNTERMAVRAIADEARAEADKNGKISSETLARAREAIKTFHTKLTATFPPGSKGLREAENFVKAAYGLTRMLEEPQVDEFLKELDSMETTSLGSVIGFMNTFNLRFGAASTPAQRNAYDQLYPKLKTLRNEVNPQTPAVAATTSDPSQNADEFFSGMQLDDVQNKRPLTPAPAPGNP